MLTLAQGLNFAIILTNNGHLYSWGDNIAGQLGHGDAVKRSEPTLIDKLEEKITEVSCGMSHVLARTTLGKIYSWGWGERGQLGLGVASNVSVPKQVQLDNRVIQIMSGAKCSICLMEGNHSLYWWGTNGKIQYELRPVEVQLPYQAVRVIASWSRTMSVITITYGISTLGNQLKLRNKVIGQITSKWIENGDIRQIDIPYCDFLANYLNVQLMRKPQIKPNIKFASKIEHQNILKELQGNSNNVKIIQPEYLNLGNFERDRDTSMKLNYHQEQVGDYHRTRELHELIFKNQ